jgi:hypothetical protein
MENDTVEKNIMIDEIGNLAKFIDTELSVFERMKIKKTTMVRIFWAILVYIVTMIIFTLIL